jgi:hypothetical protein
MIAGLSKAVLVLLIGIYAIRSSWFLFGVVSPLTPVAMAVLALCITLFHRPPTEIGWWFGAVIAACIVGAIANADPTNRLFSMISLGAFVAYGLLQSWAILARPAA